jgi:hypothetical protein
VRSIFRGDRYKITAEIGDLVPFKARTSKHRERPL